VAAGRRGGGGQAAGRGARGGGRGAVQNAQLDQITPEQRAEYELALARIDAEYPPAGRATVNDFVDHIDYARLTPLRA
jgi:hypothetical protein